MSSPIRFRVLLPLAALGLAALLGGCVAYPAYPAYSYDGGYYGTPYASGGVVAFGGGWGDDGWRGRRWHHHWRGGYRGW
jgi:hypothetical protein